MQQILGYMRRAVTDYKMIQPGDHIAVGVSGGKDSMVLAAGLSRMCRFLGIEYRITAITLDPCFGGKETDYSEVARFFETEGIPHVIRRTHIGEIIFDIRREEHPCSLCARMRRGALHDLSKELGCNKIALGHHMDDALETFFMSLFQEGRLGLFSPVTYLSRKDLTMIRPLIYAPEKAVRAAVRHAGIPVVKSPCPADGVTQRQKMKEFVAQMDREDHGFKERVFGAIRRSGLSGF